MKLPHREDRIEYDKSDPNVIAFYTTKEVPYGCFSNFYRSSVRMDGLVWPTSEHYYQAQKFPTDYNLREEIRNAENPKMAATLGRTKSPVRDDWQRVKYDVMLSVVYQKFKQHPHLKAILLSTGDKHIVEWTEGTSLADDIWGNAKKAGWPGLNYLGKVLMEVREILRDEDENRLDI